MGEKLSLDRSHAPQARRNSAASGKLGHYPEDLQLDSELETAGGPGYSTIGSPITTSVGVWSYSTSATEPNGSTLDGTVNFQVSDINIIEKPIGAATPEPSMAILLGAALCSLVLYRSVFPHRNRRRLSTEGTK